MPRHFISSGLPALAALIAGCATGPSPAPVTAPAAPTVPAPQPAPQAQPSAAALPPGMPDLARARPAIHAISATEIDRISGRSGLTDCFWVGTVSPSTFNILIPDSGLVYWLTQFKQRYGEALVLRGQAPRTPRTFKGAAVMDTTVDLRYWSVCKYRSIADGAVDSCVYDEQAPPDAAGRYTVVVSTPAARPSNARTDCGVAWMDWGVGDGIGNPHGGFLALRHMLPAPGFGNSLWATQRPGDERTALGPFFPETTYEAKTAFEARGCPVR